MRRKRHILVVILPAVFTVLWWWLARRPTPIATTESSQTESIPSMPPLSHEGVNATKTASKPSMQALHRKQGRPIYGKLPEGIKDAQNIIMDNAVDKQWKSKLEEHIRSLGGSEIQDVKIDPQDSYVLIENNGHGRYVESVVVRVKNAHGDLSTFRAEVDGQSGIVLKTWDRSIHENSEKHSHLKLKFGALPLKPAAPSP